MGGVILVIEDDQATATFVHKVLESGGYRVLHVRHHIR